MLELKALREGAWKLSEYTAYSKNLVMRVTPDLRALLKVANRAHPSVHAMLIDLSAYKPKFIMLGSDLSLIIFYQHSLATC